ncbi:MAG: hypothetical protein M3Z66_07460 [Chloroflexota bacterium]|nr:hypothetical protein [Chloroflexota bacterium]
MIGIPALDALATLGKPTLEDYVEAASAYVLGARALDAGARKAGQIRLSDALGRALLAELRLRLPTMGPGAMVGERDVAGALRTAKVDVSEMHALDGLRLAVELKPVNLAVGRALWNRFGDIRMTAVNVHLKFPFAVVGGVLTIPTFEEDIRPDGQVARKSTEHLIARVIDRLDRAGGRRTEGDPAYLLEGVGVVVYDPESAVLSDSLPVSSSSLRWEGFVASLVGAYTARFG